MVREAGDARRGGREGQRVRTPQQRRGRRERGAAADGRFHGWMELNLIMGNWGGRMKDL